MAKFALQALYPRERIPVYVEQEAGWVPYPVWMFWRRGKALSSSGIQTPDHKIRNLVTILTTLSRRLRSFVVFLVSSKTCQSGTPNLAATTIFLITSGYFLSSNRLTLCTPGTTNFLYTGLFISPSGISELDCATTKTDTAERSISIGRETLQVSFCTRGLGVLPGSTARG